MTLSEILNYSENELVQSEIFSNCDEKGKQ